MFGNGMEKEIIIRILPRVEQVSPSMFNSGGMQEFDFERLLIWADKDYSKNFSKVPGVIRVDVSDYHPNKYLVCVDPRYNIKWVMAEIEAVVKTEKPTPKRKSRNDNQV